MSDEAAVAFYYLLFIKLQLMEFTLDRLDSFIFRIGSHNLFKRVLAARSQTIDCAVSLYFYLLQSYDIAELSLGIT